MFVSSMKSKLKRTRLALLPPIPTTLQEVNLPEEWSRTWKGRRFLQKLTKTVWGVAVFCSR